MTAYLQADQCCFALLDAAAGPLPAQKTPTVASVMGTCSMATRTHARTHMLTHKHTHGQHRGTPCEQDTGLHKLLAYGSCCLSDRQSHVHVVRPLHLDKEVHPTLLATGFPALLYL